MTFAGTVKTLKTIAMDDGTELFVTGKACADGKTLQVGDKVMFDLEDNPATPGEYMAGNISGGSGSMGGGGQWGASAGGWNAAAGWGGGGGASWGNAAVAGTGSNTGTVSKFMADKGFGFLQGADGTQYFFHVKQFVDGSTPNIGDNLTFDLEPSPMKPGQMQACKITGGTGAATGKGGGGKGGGGGGASWGNAAVAGTGSQTTGTVSKFQPDKGFGFLQGADGSQYFFHVKQFVDGSTPNIGDTLTFGLEPSPLKPGQMQACSITGGSGAGKGGGKGYGAAAAGDGNGAAGPYGAAAGGASWGAAAGW